jgi:DNA-binding response OmpR family regulator
MARILIAEDDAIAASVLANALMNAGHAVGVLGNGRDALLTIRAKRPDIVILDGDLPEMHGLTVLRDLRHDAQVWHTPVFMLTASRSRGDGTTSSR